MTQGVHVVREPGKLVPADYIARVSKGSTGFGSAITHAKGTRIVTRKTVGEVPASEIANFQQVDGLKNVTVAMHFNHSTGSVAEEDLQPYTLLQNDDDTAALVCFMDGDFSQFAQEKSSHPPEYHCVQDEILPRLIKFVNLTDGDLDKIMDELGDKDTSHIWGNFMIGDRGSITLLCCNGRVQTITLAEDKTYKQHEGWWTSDNKGYGEKPKSLGESAAAELKSGQATKPKLKLPNLGPKVPVASTDPLVAPVPGTGPQPEVGPATPAPSKDLPDLSDPNAILRVTIPTGMDLKRMHKWVSKRMPENLVPKVLTGLKFIELKRSQAPGPFLQTFLEQNKLQGLTLLKNTTTPAPDVDTAKTTTVPQITGAKKVIPTIGAKKTAATTPAEPAPTQTPAEPAQPAVVSEPLPVLSPNQKDELVAFTETQKVKAGMDARQLTIGSPHGLEKMEGEIDSIVKQFGGRMTPEKFASMALEDMIAYFKHDVEAGARMCFLMCFENIKLNKMLDQFTDPHTTKKQEAEKQPAQEQPAAQRKINIPKIGAKKVA